MGSVQGNRVLNQIAAALAVARFVSWRTRGVRAAYWFVSPCAGMSHLFRGLGLFLGNDGADRFAAEPDLGVRRFVDFDEHLAVADLDDLPVHAAGGQHLVAALHLA